MIGRALSIALVGILLLHACKERALLEPATRLDDSTLVLLMTDAFILQSAFRQTFGAVRDSMSEVYTQQLLQKYDISKEVYDDNMRWLDAHPGKLDSIYAKILDRASNLENKISRASAQMPDK